MHSMQPPIEVSVLHGSGTAWAEARAASSRPAEASASGFIAPAQCKQWGRALRTS
jgi:hypothetical protein